MPDRQAVPDPTHPARAQRTAGERALRRACSTLATLAVVLYFALGVAVLAVRYIVVPHIDAWRPRIAALASRALHAQVEIGHLSASWQGPSPAFTVDNLTIRPADVDPAAIHGAAPALAVRHVSGSIAWRSLLRLRPVFASLVIDGADVLAQRAADGRISIAGIRLSTAGTHPYAFTDWLLLQDAVILRNGTLHWHDAAVQAPPLTLSDVRFAALNSGRQHQLGLQARDASGHALDTIDVRAQFQHARFSEVGKPANWQGRAYASVSALDLPTLGRYVPLPLLAYHGTTGGHAWLAFSNGRLDNAQGALRGDALSLRANARLPRLDIPAASSRFSVSHTGDEFALSGRDVALELAGQPPLADGTPVLRTLRVNRFDGRYRPPSSRDGELVSFAGDVADVELLSELALALPLPARAASTLKAFEPRGMLYDYRIGWQRSPRAAPTAVTPAAPATALPAATPPAATLVDLYNVDARIEGLGMTAQPPAPGLNPAGHPHIGIPGFDNLSGTIVADQARGTLSLASRDAAVTIPGLFDAPRLELATLAGQIRWTATRNPAGAGRQIDASATGLTLSNADMSAYGTAHYTGSTTAPRQGHLDLQATLDQLRLVTVARYMPTSIDAHLRSFLGHAIQAGHGFDGSVTVSGPIDQFPYQRNPAAGTFRLGAHYTNGRFDASPYPPVRLASGALDSWPAVDGIDGSILVDGNRLAIDVSRGRYRRVLLAGVTGRIANMADHDEDLAIAGRANGPLADLLDYLNHSPIPALTGHLTERLSGTGDAALTMRLLVPRRPPTPQGAQAPPPRLHPQVNGTLQLAGNTLVYAHAPPVTALTGQLAFTERSLSLNGISGIFLGGPVSARGSVLDGAIDVAAAGHADVGAMKTLGAPGDASQAGLLEPVIARLSGIAPYAVTVRAVRHGTPDIAVQSDLSGLAIDLPAPLGKAAATPMRFSFTMHPVEPTSPGSVSSSAGAATAGAAAVSRIDLVAGQISAAYLRRGGADPAVLAGAIAINRPLLLPPRGVTASVALDAFDADAWRTVIGDLKADRARSAALAPAAATPPSQRSSATNAVAATAPAAGPPIALAPWLPDSAELAIGEMTLFSRHWQNITVNAKRRGAGWEAALNSTQVAGSAAWQPGGANDAGAVQARLSRLLVPAPLRSTGDTAPFRTPPQKFPALDLSAERVMVERREFGKLRMTAHNTLADGLPVWQLDALTLDDGAGQLSASGSWRGTAAPSSGQAQPGQAAGASAQGSRGDSIISAVQAAGVTGAPRHAAQLSATPVPTSAHTEFKFKLDVQDGGALLQRLGLPRTLQDGNGQVAGQVGWDGTPAALDFGSLAGTVSLDLRRGQILKVDPGIARLLGVLSLQSLARYLTLDFSGVAGRGLAFDRVHGSGTIVGGDFRTHDFDLNGPTAHITMAGHADLGREQQDLTVHVEPHISAGTASLAAAVVNPVLGLGTLVAQLVLSQPIERSLARQYRITGSWAKPQIERVHDNRGNINAQPAGDGR